MGRVRHISLMCLATYLHTIVETHSFKPKLQVIQVSVFMGAGTVSAWLTHIIPVWNPTGR